VPVGYDMPTMLTGARLPRSRPVRLTGQKTGIRLIEAKFQAFPGIWPTRAPASIMRCTPDPSQDWS
jgi:hypothetical protein